MLVISALSSTTSAATNFCPHAKIDHSLSPPSSLKPHKHHQALTFPSFHAKPTLLPPKRSLCPPPFGEHLGDAYVVKKWSAKEVQDLVRGERTVPIVIGFYATWCGPCVMMAQELEMLAIENENNALVVKVDTDDEYEFAQDMQVRGLPTLYFISPDPNKNAIRTEGLIPLQMMKDILDNDM